MLFPCVFCFWGEVCVFAGFVVVWPFVLICVFVLNLCICPCFFQFPSSSKELKSKVFHVSIGLSC